MNPLIRNAAPNDVEIIAKIDMETMQSAFRAQNPARKFLEALGAVFMASTTYYVAGKKLERVSYGWTDTAILRL